MGNTPNWNIYYAENGAPADARTESATQAGTVETALDSVGGDIVSVNNFGVQYFANASARDLALTSPSVGWLTQLDSELFMRRWDGAAWVPYGAGLYPIKPSSVAGTGVSIDSLGRVVFSAATSVNVNGVFSSDFRDYILEYELTSTSADLGSQLRLRASGTDAATNYSNHYLQGTGTSAGSATAGDTTVTYLQIGTGSQTNSRMTVRRPAISGTTGFRTEFGAFTAAGAGFEGIITARHTTSAAYDGFSIIPTTGNITGLVRILGVG